MSESCVKLFRAKLDFVEAVINCRMYKARLVEIDDVYEEVALKTLFA